MTQTRFKTLTRYDIARYNNQICVTLVILCQLHKNNTTKSGI